jgi:hypothetical protein
MIRLPILALMALLLTAAAHAQSVTDVARASRENRLQNAPEKVITNDDLAESAQGRPDAPNDVLPDPSDHSETSAGVPHATD